MRLLGFAQVLLARYVELASEQTARNRAGFDASAHNVVVAKLIAQNISIQPVKSAQYSSNSASSESYSLATPVPFRSTLLVLMMSPTTAFFLPITPHRTARFEQHPHILGREPIRQMLRYWRQIMHQFSPAVQQ